jgi:hypothetical protein
MNLNLTGVHLEITPAIRAYVVTKLDRVTRHFDHMIDVNVVLSVDKLRQKVEATMCAARNPRGIDPEPDMYRHRLPRRQAGPAGCKIQRKSCPRTARIARRSNARFRPSRGRRFDLPAD